MTRTNQPTLFLALERGVRMIRAMISRRFPAYFALPTVVLSTAICSAQGITQTSVPLGEALDHALQHGSLVGKDVKPFHIKVHVFESTNPDSDYHAEIEEYWVSDQQWRRQVESSDFKQVKIVNKSQVSEDDKGDYYPLWLKEMVTALFDPVPNREHWDRLGTKITQIALPTACARTRVRVTSSRWDQTPSRTTPSQMFALMAMGY
jgi:hypothetical protein